MISCTLIDLQKDSLDGKQALTGPDMQNPPFVSVVQYVKHTFLAPVFLLCEDYAHRGRPRR